MEDFANEYNVTDILPQLKKGALVARDPEDFEAVPDLTEQEVMALRDEVLHKWRQPKALYFTIILCSIGAAVQYVNLPQEQFRIYTDYISEAGIKPAPTVPISPSPTPSVFPRKGTRSTNGSSALLTRLRTLQVLAWAAGCLTH